MALEIGVVCARCERYSPIGTTACVCGHALAIGSSAQPVAEAEGGLEGPVSSLFDTDELKPRRALHSQPGETSAAPAGRPMGPEGSVTALRAHAGHSAVSSSGAAGDGPAPALQRQRSEPSLEELMDQA